MAALPFFKKKEEKVTKPVTVKKPEATLKTEEKPVAEKVAPKKAAPKKTRKGDFIGALTSPHVTEKATMLAQKNQYVFKVEATATKGTVKQAVESQYGVSVDAVRMITVPSKKKRIGKIMGIKKGYRKAIVKVREGQSLEILPR